MQTMEFVDLSGASGNYRLFQKLKILYSVVCLHLVQKVLDLTYPSRANVKAENGTGLFLIHAMFDCVL